MSGITVVKESAYRRRQKDTLKLFWRPVGRQVSLEDTAPHSIEIV